MLLNSSNNNNNNIHLFIDLLLLNNTRNCIFTISLQNNSFLQLNWNRQNVIEQKFIQMLYICKFHFPYLYTAEQWEVRAWSWCSFNSHYYSRLLVPHNSHIFFTLSHLVDVILGSRSANVKKATITESWTLWYVLKVINFWLANKGNPLRSEHRLRPQLVA